MIDAYSIYHAHCKRRAFEDQEIQMHANIGADVMIWKMKISSYRRRNDVDRSSKETYKTMDELLTCALRLCLIQKSALQKSFLRRYVRHDISTCWTCL